MKKLLFLTSFSLLVSIAFSQTMILPSDAKKHIGDSVRILGIVVSAEHNEKEKKSYVYFTEMSPKQDLTVIIPDADLVNFPVSLQSFQNKICVIIGKIQLINKKPAIIAHSYNEFAPGPGQ